MKRPPGIWFLLSAGVLWLSIHNVYGLKATELIFKKTTSTTTTTEVSVSNEPLADEVSTESAAEGTNVTKSMLTGIPQIDYILDPNLPRELNGYNLSSYPFYNTMPENITFKCEGLHDGFYASIQHKCQVYHHCLSGTRYDFLCANYTAFDQTIFNCHFVSEVDCNNSYKYWHRNDALYKSPSTTTTVPPTPIVISPALTGLPKRPPPPLGRRRPPARRRPQYEYYDDEEYEDAEKEDYYEPPLRRRRKRPRPRPRPVYDDDYEEYEDRHERRSSGKRNEDRRHEYEDEERRLNEKPNDRRINDNKQEKRNDKRKPYDDRRYKDERRREYEQDGDEEDEYTYRRRPAEKRRPSYERPRKPQRRPHDDDFYEDEKSDEKHVPRERPQKIPKTQPENDGVALVKPHGPSSLYNQPRMPPRIKPPPLPRNYPKPTSSEKPTTVKAHTDDTEYYEDYDDATASAKTTTTTKAPEFEPSTKRSKLRTTPKPHAYDDEYDVDTLSLGSSPNKPVASDGRETNNRFAAPKFFPIENRPKLSSPTPSVTTTLTTTTVATTTVATTTTTESPKDRSEPIVRVVKRPFLPSRGGNPYSIRGLQPVGAKALDTSNYETDLPESVDKFESDPLPSTQNGRQFPAQPQANKPLLRELSFIKPIEVLEVERTKAQIATQSIFVSKPEEQQRIKAKIPERNPLDINEDDYDVTLNDALNPTIPNLPVRNFPTGFGVPPTDYSYNSIPRQRYNVGYNIPPESFLPKRIKQRDETVVAQPQNYRNHGHSSSQNFRGSPQLTQANTQGFYNVF